MNFADAIKPYSGQPLTRQVLLDLLKDYKRPFDKISELVRQEQLISIKRGVFIAGPGISVAVPEYPLLANHLWGPSYMSADSALSFWGMIPERVYETISMTTNLAKEYTTPIGRFRYIKLPLPYYSLGIQSVVLGTSQIALIASREKAFCDKIVTTHRLTLRSKKQVKDYLLDDLRIDRDALVNLDIQTIESFLAEAPKQDSLSMLVKTLTEL